MTGWIDSGSSQGWTNDWTHEAIGALQESFGRGLPKADFAAIHNF
jgi:hypothetical protein